MQTVQPDQPRSDRAGWAKVFIGVAVLVLLLVLTMWLPGQAPTDPLLPFVIVSMALCFVLAVLNPVAALAGGAMMVLGAWLYAPNETTAVACSALEFVQLGGALGC